MLCNVVNEVAAQLLSGAMLCLGDFVDALSGMTNRGHTPPIAIYTGAYVTRPRRAAEPLARKTLWRSTHAR